MCGHTGSEHRPLGSESQHCRPRCQARFSSLSCFPPDPCVLAFLFCQHASVESTPPLQSSATFSTAATSASSATSSGLSSVNTGNSLCLGGTTVSAPSSTRATPLVTSGVCPRGLSHLPPAPQRCTLGFPGRVPINCQDAMHLRGS